MDTDSIEASDIDNSYLNTLDNSDTIADQESNIQKDNENPDTPIDNGDSQTENDNEVPNTENQESNTEIDSEEPNDCLESAEENTPVLSSTSNQETIKETETVNKAKTKIIVKSESVVKERNLALQLFDSKDKALANKKISIHIGDQTYANTTDKNGKISLKISLDPGEYTVKVHFSGDKNYSQTSKTFTMKVYKIKTNFTVPKTSIIRGQYFYAYLKDKNNNPLASRHITINYNNKIYHKTTDKNGRIRFQINSKIGKYKMKLIYKGCDSYHNTTKELTVKSYDAKVNITFLKKKVVRNKYIYLNLTYGKDKILANRKLTFIFEGKKYERTTNKKGKARLKLTKPVGKYEIKVKFAGSKGFKKLSRTTEIKILPNYTAIFAFKNMTAHLNSSKTYRINIKLKDLKGNPIKKEKVTIKVKCNNFTLGSNIKITKKTIVLSSDNIVTKRVDKKRLKDMAKLLRAKGYKVIISGIGPNYHVSDVKKYKNVCVFSLVGGIDSGMFVDMANGYYQSYLKHNHNQFVLGCLPPPKNINLANRTWLKRAHDDNYSPRKFKGLYFPGKYLNTKTHVDYVYGATPKELVNNFMNYGRKGRSIGLNNTLPGQYTTYKLTTSKYGYVHLNLPIGNHTIVCSYQNKKKGYTTDTLTTWVNVIK